jgi:hypothetical protein
VSDARSARWNGTLSLKRIGELTAKLEKAPQAKGGSRHPSTGKPTKIAALKAAGISTSEANRTERQRAMLTHNTQHTHHTHTRETTKLRRNN